MKAKQFLHLIPLVSLLLLAAVILSEDRYVGDNNRCISCHQDVYKKAQNSRYRHTVVLEKCSQCHLLHEMKKGDAKEVSFSSHKTRYVFAQRDLSKGGYNMDVIVRDKAGLANTSTVPLVPANVKTVRNDMILPSIKNVKIGDIRQTGFINIDISWGTDRPAVSQIEYGTSPQYGRRTYAGNVFLKEHMLTLSGLAKNSTYHFRITAKDVFGHTAMSEDYTLDTANPLPLSAKAAQTSALGENAVEGRPNVNSIKFYRIEDKGDIFADISINKPSNIIVRFTEDVSQKEDVNHGYGFLSPRAKGIDVCVKCHPQNVSHPVGIKVKGAGIKLPKFLPTIEDNVMTCATCHEPHGGNLKFMTRKDFKRDVCAECHMEESFD